MFMEKLISKFNKLYYYCLPERKRNKFGYRKQYSDSSVEFYKRGYFNKKILSTCENWAVLQSPVKNDVLYLYPNINSRRKRRIHISPTVLPGLIEGSKVVQCMLLPYMREVEKGVFVRSMRLNIITDKCQVFHNYPARGKEYENRSNANDVACFEESAIWDLPGHLYPSKERECEDVERYYPYLPDSAYEYHPLLNSDATFLDRYQNGGFGRKTRVRFQGKSVSVSRFYFPKRALASNSFFHIGGEELNDKMTVIGTYRGNNDGNGVRTVVFATSDGGRNWFAKYEFGDVGEYPFSQGTKDWRTAFGNAVKLPVCSGNETKGLSVTKREVVLPTEKCKEPSVLFHWGDRICVSEIEQKETAVIKTGEKHGLETGNIIAITNDCDADCPYANNTISELSGGNGILYKVQVIDDYAFEAYEFVASASNPICCRHIHQINRVKDGWLIGTGEIYPNGWLLYMQMREADTYSVVSAADEFQIVRLNSTEESVQRTLGAIMLDDEDSTIIFASDHDLLPRRTINAPEGRKLSISRSSTGIFQGKLKDIDNRNLFSVIYEAQEPSFFFKSIRGIYVFAGQRGEFAFSANRGKNWKTYRINTATSYFKGFNHWYLVIGDYIIVLKN